MIKYSIIFYNDEYNDPFFSILLHITSYKQRHLFFTLQQYK